MDAFGEGAFTHECFLSQSVSVPSSLKNAVSDGHQMVCLKKMFNGKIIFHLNRRLKKLCYYK